MNLVARLDSSNEQERRECKAQEAKEISRNSLPTNERLRLFDAFDVSQDELRVDTPILKDIVLADFGQRDWEAISRIREAIMVSGTRMTSKTLVRTPSR
jgi:hypothetical protein